MSQRSLARLIYAAHDHEVRIILVNDVVLLELLRVAGCLDKVHFTEANSVDESLRKNWVPPVSDFGSELVSVIVRAMSDTFAALLRRFDFIQTLSRWILSWKAARDVVALGWKAVAKIDNRWEYVR